MAAARLETLLRTHGSRRVLVGSAGALGRLIEEHEPAAVVLASTADRVLAILRAASDTMPVPPVVALVDEPRAAWTAASRRAGVRAVLDSRAGVDELSAALAAALAGLVTLHPDVFRAPDRGAALS